MKSCLPLAERDMITGHPRVNAAPGDFADIQCGMAMHEFTPVRGSGETLRQTDTLSCTPDNAARTAPALDVASPFPLSQCTNPDSATPGHHAVASVAS